MVGWCFVLVFVLSLVLNLGLIRKSSGLVVRAVSHNLGENDRMQNISPFRWGFTASDRKEAY